MAFRSIARLTTSLSSSKILSFIGNLFFFNLAKKLQFEIEQVNEEYIQNTQIHESMQTD